MVYGYCRISTRKQSISRQIDNIRREYPDAVIVEEEYTGTKIDRPKWTRLYRQLKEGDTIVFDEVSRMSRNAEEGFSLYKDLYDQGINLVFLKEPHINTSVYRDSMCNGIALTGVEIADMYIETTNKVLMLLAEKQIQLSFEQAQKEVDYLHQRTREGIEQARLNGKRIGLPAGTKLVTKKSIAAKEKILKHNKTFGGALNDIETIELTKISRKTFYKYKRELVEEG